MWSVDDELRARLAGNRARADELVAAAAAAARRGARTEALAWAQMAAALAWHNHDGRFARPALEATVRATLRPGPASRRARAADPRAVLHVLTLATAVGGHTRLVWRWIEADRARRHSVLLTQQGEVPLPPALVAAARASGGTVQRLPVHAPLDVRAARLGDAAAAADLVVLHTHPYDPTPLAALDGAVPVALMNHADHVAWIGAGAADVVVHFRASGLELSRARRGLDPAASALLPLPLAPRAGLPSRAEARRQLGIGSDARLLVTMAAAYKLAPVPGHDFVAALTPLVAADARLELRALGPAPDDPRWRAAADATGGRLRAVGTVLDPTPYLCAADVYLDSFPFSSLTSLLEAALAGVPPLVLAPPGRGTAVLASDDVALAGLDGWRAADLDEHAARLRALVGDEAARRRLGEAARELVHAHHTGAGFTAALAGVYQAVAARGGPLALDGAVAERALDDDLDGLLLLLHQRGGHTRPAAAVVEDHLDLLPPPARLRAWLRLRRDGGARLRSLVPSRLRPPLRWVRARLVGARPS